MLPVHVFLRHAAKGTRARIRRLTQSAQPASVLFESEKDKNEQIEEEGLRNPLVDIERSGGV